MIALVLYTLVAFLIVVLAAVLVRRSGSPEETEDDVQHLSEETCLSLAERIFDPADFLWLRDDLVFPHLARTLARSRKQMALRWLRALRRSFNELATVPEPAGPGVVGRGSSSWQLLWLTLRFHSLLSYALLVVHLFGPYHRLVPSLPGASFLRHSHGRTARYGAAGTGDPL